MQQFKGRQLLFICLLLCSGCSWLSQRMAVTRCNFEWVSVRHEKTSLSETQFNIDLKIQNPNNSDATLDRIVYTFYADELKLAEGRTLNPISVPPGETADLPIELTVPHLSSITAIARIYKGEVSKYRLVARIYMRTVLGEISYDIDLWSQSS